MRLRLNASDLDTFRLWRDFDWMSLEDYIAKVTRTEERTTDMRLGLDFEDILMRRVSPEKRFEFAAEKELAILPFETVQVPIEVVYTWADHEVTIAGRLDAINARRVIDWKTTTKAIDYDKYASAYQWKIYLVGTGYKDFTYEIFQLRGSRSDPLLYNVVEHMRFDLYWFPGMETEVRAAVRGYLDSLLSLEASGRIILTERGAKLPPQPKEPAGAQEEDKDAPPDDPTLAHPSGLVSPRQQ